MNIDISALRMIEADKGIPIDTVITAIETALLTAYRHTDGFAPHARIDVNRKTGEVRSWPKRSTRTASSSTSGTTPRGLRPHRRHHRPPGHPAAPA